MSARLLQLILLDTPICVSRTWINFPSCISLCDFCDHCYQLFEQHEDQAQPMG